jgi:hypothetical protein
MGSDRDDRQYLEERYREDDGRSPLLEAYYAVKPVLPRRLQLALRRAYSRRQAATVFPHWPIEPVLVERREGRLRREVKRRAGPLPLIADWPGGAGFAAILTHDVEGPEGVERVEAVIELEQEYGFVSSWNFVAEWYEIPVGLFDTVRAAGCEVGLHAVKHDGRLFKDRATFEAELPHIHHYLAKWEVEGFRSPATHRNPDWMPELGAAYDSSFPDADPFEPQGGGCCSILPFFLGDMVELPITLVQDHTLWEILRRDSIDLWVEKSEWVAAHGGLVNLIVHPDYLDRPERWRMYEEFLEHLAEMRAERRGWAALPREVAEWWRQRAGMWLVEEDDMALIVGPGAGRGAVVWATLDGDRLAIDPERAAAA